MCLELMVQKRQHKEIDEIGVQHQEPNQRNRLWITGMPCSYVGRILLTKEDISSLEPILRQYVRDEVERVILHRKLSSPCNDPFSEAETSRRRDFRLHFRNQLASDIFTFEEIRALDGKPLQVVLCDSSSEDAIVKSGPLSSAKVDILVVNGDFGSGCLGDWNEVEFKKSVLCARQGKRPLLIGTLSITLKDGVGFIFNLKFTDNSAWTRGGKFRLAARIKLKIFVDRVREAISEPFRVKDHRGERNKKHYPPHLEDELWRLDGISKDGPMHERLTSNNVKTVKDFLQKFETDRSSLRRMISRISDREWNRLVDHARTCEMDKKLNTGPSTSAQNSDLAVTLQSSRNFNFAVPGDQPVLDGSTSYNFEANLGADSFSNTQKSSADGCEMHFGVDSLHDWQNSLATRLINSTVAQKLDTTIKDDFVGEGFSFGHYNGETSRSGYLDHGAPVELSTFITETNAWDQINQFFP